jgi:hypothetical protein
MGSILASTLTALVCCLTEYWRHSMSSKGWHVQWEVSPIGAGVRNPVAWVASVEETKRMEPTDKAILGMASESPGRNESELNGGLDKKKNPEAESFPSGRRQYEVLQPD